MTYTRIPEGIEAAVHAEAERIDWPRGRYGHAEWKAADGRKLWGAAEDLGVGELEQAAAYSTELGVAAIVRYERAPSAKRAATAARHILRANDFRLRASLLLPGDAEVDPAELPFPITTEQPE